MKDSAQSFLSSFKAHPITTGLIGSISGWFSFDLLRASQIFAGVTAGLLSLTTLFITIPKAYQYARWWRVCLRRLRKKGRLKL